MNKNFVSKILFLFSTLVLTGCGVSTASIVDSIENATAKNAEMENARFETLLSTKNDAEQYDQHAEGAFIKKADEEYDWYQKTSLGEESTIEVLQIDGKEYQKVTFFSDSESQWMESPMTSTSLQRVLGSLFKSNLDEGEISDRTIEEKGNITRYILTMNDDYAERIKSENMEALQQHIDVLKNDKTDEQVIQGIETQIQFVEDTSYQDHALIYEIEDDFLTSFTMEATVQPPEGDSFTMVNRLSLTEFNLDHTEDFLPIMEE